MVRSACKFLLYDEIERGGRIHYALDGIDVRDVATAAHRELDDTRSKVPVCTSELREIFRMWSYFATYVTFYNRLKIADPPWTNGPADLMRLWCEYALARARKALALAPQATAVFVQNTVTEIETALGREQYDQGISAYHSMPWHWLKKKALPFELPFRF
jgi:hypothetical protein